eukprot:3499505-Rhodomonas_salina.4
MATVESVGVQQRLMRTRDIPNVCSSSECECDERSKRLAEAHRIMFTSKPDKSLQRASNIHFEQSCAFRTNRVVFVVRRNEPDPQLDLHRRFSSSYHLHRSPSIRSTLFQPTFFQRRFYAKQGSGPKLRGSWVGFDGRDV